MYLCPTSWINVLLGSSTQIIWCCLGQCQRNKGISFFLLHAYRTQQILQVIKRTASVCCTVALRTYGHGYTTVSPFPTVKEAQNVQAGSGHASSSVHIQQIYIQARHGFDRFYCSPCAPSGFAAVSSWSSGDVLAWGSPCWELCDGSARSNRELSALSILDLFIKRPSAEDADARTAASADWLMLLTNIANTLTNTER